ncbi:hypothetical protein CYY_007871 [Polysphondylium violaceum]|uniref:WD40 repeat-containing protein n=1 Tax=Polysphondylium violaceum TaxID=133409 RepID=A0A8J4PNQ2_9MYCE|nr:hypothetical protein CYY_007871 [Polysphondylium violaceum]
MALPFLSAEILVYIYREFEARDCYNFLFICKFLTIKLEKDENFWLYLIHLHGKGPSTLIRHNLDIMELRQLNSQNKDPDASLKYIKDYFKKRSWLFKYLNNNKQHGGSSGERFKKYFKEENIILGSICSCPFESNVVIGGYDQKSSSPVLKMLNYKGETIADLLSPKIREKKNISGDVRSISCKNNIIAFNTSYSNDVGIFGIGKDRKVRENFIKVGNQRTNLQVRLNNNGDELAVCSLDGGCSLYDIEKKERLSGFSEPQMPINGFNFSFDDNLFFIAGTSKQNGRQSYKNTGYVKMWDIRQGNGQGNNSVVKCWKEYAECCSISQSEDANFLAYVMNTGITRVIDLRTDQLFSTFAPAYSRIHNFEEQNKVVNEDVCWSPGGHRMLASTSRGNIYFWNTHNGEIILDLEIKKHHESHQIDISDDGSTLYSSLGYIYSVNDVTDIAIYAYLNGLEAEQ